MKRLNMPKIPTRIPVPDLSSIRTRSRKKVQDESVTEPVKPVAEEPAPQAQSPEQPIAEKPAEAKEASHHKANMQISLPKIPKPAFHKPNAPKLSMPKMPALHKSKENLEETPAAPPVTGSETAAAEQPPAGEGDKKPRMKITGIRMPSFHKAKEKPETAAAVQQAPQIETPPAVPDVRPSPPLMAPSPVEAPPAQARTQQPPPAAVPPAPAATPETPKAKSKAKLSMPKMPKMGMPSMSMSKGKGGATRATGKRILALSIEGNDIRILSYSNNAVDSWKSVPFGANLLKMGQVADPVGMGEVIKSAVEGIDTARCYVLCAMPGLKSVSRIISVPNVNKKDMEALIPREVRRTMTVSEEDNYFHWQVLPVEAAQARVFVLAVPKEPMSLLLQSLSNAGLHPSQIDLKPLALMRAINQKDAIIANCEGNSMELVIVSDDIPVLIRSVFLGEGVANQDYAVGRISDELGRTVVTYNEINKERPLDQDVPIYLTGAAASGVPFALNVAALTGRTVQPLEAPVTVPADLPIAEYMVNIGLILKVV